MTAAVTETGERRRAAGRLVARTLIGAVAGAAVIALATTVDRALLPPLPVPVDHAQLLLGTLAGATVTVVVFALWMRTVVVGLLSSQVSPRIVTGYLDDGFQRWVITVGVGLVTFLSLAVLTLPSLDEPGAGAPPVTTALGLLGTVVAVAGVLWSVQVAVRDLSLPHVIREVADEALRVLDQQVEADHDPPEQPVGEDVETLTAERMGWVTAIDRPALLAAVPVGTTVTLDAEVGDFVAVHQIVARTDRQLDDDGRAAVLDAIVLGRTRSTRHDLAYAIQPLVDIAEHAMSATSNDTSTAHEALVHLRAVLHELILRGPVTGWWTDGEGRWTRSHDVREPVDHVFVAVERLGAVAATAPMQREVRDLLEHLGATARQLGAEEVLRRLEEQRTALDHR